MGDKGRLFEQQSRVVLEMSFIVNDDSWYSIDLIITNMIMEYELFNTTRL